MILNIGHLSSSIKDHYMAYRAYGVLQRKELLLFPAYSSICQVNHPFRARIIPIITNYVQTDHFVPHHSPSTTGSAIVSIPFFLSTYGLIRPNLERLLNPHHRIELFLPNSSTGQTGSNNYLLIDISSLERIAILSFQNRLHPHHVS